MKVAVFSTKRYDRISLSEANVAGMHTLEFLEPSLGERTAAFAADYPVVCPFVNDRLTPEVLEILSGGVPPPRSEPAQRPESDAPVGLQPRRCLVIGLRCGSAACAGI